MSDEPTTEEVTRWDAPNQQVVRGDGSPPWQEGEGGTAQPTRGHTTTDLDAMTKQELLEHARALGVTPANHDMTKDELRAGIDAKNAEA